PPAHRPRKCWCRRSSPACASWVPTAASMTWPANPRTWSSPCPRNCGSSCWAELHPGACEEQAGAGPDHFVSSAAPGLGTAATGRRGLPAGLGSLRTGAAGRSPGCAGRPRRVIGGGVLQRMEGFPADPLGIFGPQLVGLGITTNHAGFRDNAATGSIEAPANLPQAFVAVGLQAKVVNPRLAPAGGNGEVDARV